MNSRSGETDEDKQIARLRVHRDLIGWIVDRLQEAGIQAERTTGGNANGDIEICDRNAILQAKEILVQLTDRSSRSLTSSQCNNEETRNYLEVKAYTSKKVDSTLAKKLIQKETIIGVVTTGKITKPAKKLLDESGIVWVEEFSENNLKSSES